MNPAGGVHSEAGRDVHAHVGPKEEWDVIGAIQFSLLVAAGMRQTHRLLDVGCGSLRGGRFSILYLEPDHYCGIEPFEDLVKHGLEHEIGETLVVDRKPRFAFVDDFDTSSFGEEFDYAMAQSIFSHTHPAMARQAFRQIGSVLAPDGVLLANYTRDRLFVPRLAQVPTEDAGWAYPATVRYHFSDIQRLASEAGLHAHRTRYVHPRLTWFVVARNPERARAVARLIPKAYRPLNALEIMPIDVLRRISQTKGKASGYARRALRPPLKRRPLVHPGRPLPPPDER